MKTRLLTRLIFSFLVVVLVGPLLSMAQIDPVGSVFQVDYAGFGPDVGVNAAGDYVVVWYELGNIYAQRYFSNGLVNGTSFIVAENTQTTEGNATIGRMYIDPQVVMNDSGGFVVAGPGVISITEDGSYRAQTSFVWMQRVDPTGMPLGTPDEVDVGGTYRSAAVAMDPTGGFVVAFNKLLDSQSPVLWARRYLPNGTPTGPAFQITGLSYVSPIALDMTADGRFAVAWSDFEQPGNFAPSTPRYMFFRTFDAANQPLITVSRLDEDMDNGFHVIGGLDLAIDANEDAIVVWDRVTSSVGQSSTISGRRISLLGVPKGVAFSVYSAEFRGGEIVANPAVGVDAEGNFGVMWANGHRNRSDIPLEVMAQSFNAQGVPLGLEESIQIISNRAYYPPGLHMDSNSTGVGVAVWQRDREMTNVPWGIYGRRFRITDVQMQPMPYRYETPEALLSWLAVSNAVFYEVQVDVQINFASPRLVNEYVLAPAQSFTTPPLETRVYYWRVRALRQDNSWTEWSQIGSFVIAIP